MKQVLASGFILGVPLSLQMAMIGTLVFLMRALSAPTPPRSPADMPSTSSMMMTERLLTAGFARSPRTFRGIGSSALKSGQSEGKQQTESAVLLNPARVVFEIVSLKAVCSEDSAG